LQNLGLSPEQERALKDIDRSFQGQLQDLRSRLLAKRLEFKAALGNPQAEEQTIRTKAEELRRLWSQCQQTTTDYYLKIRSVLTPEQRQKWFSANHPCSPRNLGREP
jgi:Spy/CpxP family protein refolding chaperone